MRRYEGHPQYTARGPARYGGLARITLEASLFRPQIAISIHGGRYDSIRTLTNTRYDFKSRDSNIDLVARESWRSDRYDCYRGTARLVYQRLTTAPGSPEVLVIAIRCPIFAAAECRIGKNHCHFATLCRTGSSGRRIRSYPNHPRAPRRPDAIIELFLYHVYSVEIIYFTLPRIPRDRQAKINKPHR